MSFVKIIFLLIISTSLFATHNLQSNYYIKNDFVMLSDIVHVNKGKDKKLFNIDKHRHTKRIKRKELLKILKENGFSNYTSKHSYIQFTKQSPIDTTTIHESLKKFYTQKYQNIKISHIAITPMHYLEKLPKNYSVHFQEKAFLSNKGILYIKTDDNKKIFFQYKISATLPVVVTKKNIKKDSELNSINTRKNSIILNRFKAMPLQDLDKNNYQSKYHLKAGITITTRDVVGLYFVKRGSTISVSLKTNAINIFFSAKALQNGRLGDTIWVVKSNGKKIKVIIVGKNKAEVK